MRFLRFLSGIKPFSKATPEVICLPDNSVVDASVADVSVADVSVADASEQAAIAPSEIYGLKPAHTPRQEPKQFAPSPFDRPIFLPSANTQPPSNAGTKRTERLSAPRQEAVRNQRRRLAPEPSRVPEAQTGNWSLKHRLAALLAIIAVPAVAAAPEDFGQLPAGAPTEAELVRERLRAELARNPAMPFERPGMSFPGSAFFFLADPPEEALIALPSSDALQAATGEAGHELGAIIDAGPGANPFFSHGGTAHLRAQNCLAQAIWYEASSESEAGKRAVAQVVLNRVSHPSWPSSVCGVVYQGSNRQTGCQFTFTCDGSLSRKARGRSWDAAQRIASEALGGSVYRPIGHATHYHTLWVNPYWASSLDHVGTIGAHRFYRNRGASGEIGAFTQSYAGVEPDAAMRARGSASEPPAIEASAFTPSPIRPSSVGPSSVPSRSGRGQPSSYGAPPVASPVAGPPMAPASGPGSVKQGSGVAGAGQVREDYSRAGQWKSDTARAALIADEHKQTEKSAQESQPPR